MIAPQRHPTNDPIDLTFAAAKINAEITPRFDIAFRNPTKRSTREECSISSFISVVKVTAFHGQVILHVQSRLIGQVSGRRVGGLKPSSASSGSPATVALHGPGNLCAQSPLMSLLTITSVAYVSREKTFVRHRPIPKTG